MQTITVVTDRFATLARSQATALGKENLVFLIIPHPLGGLKEPEVEALAKVAFERLSSVLRGAVFEDDSALKSEQKPMEELLSFSSAQEACGYFEQQGWTDGLPIILPVEQLVSQFLEYAHRGKEDIVGVMPPRWVSVTVEKLAINAAMAGCLPEYFPVVLAATEAVLEPKFNLNAVQTTTHQCAVLLIINGPAGRRLGINAKGNCFGQGARANATMGRAIRLILTNVGGGIPGLTDQATMGTPAKYSYCVAENEEDSPWVPFHVEKGYTADTSTVTVVAGEAPHNINDHGSVSGEGILTTVAGTMTTTGNNNLYNRGDTFVFFGPEHAATIAKDGFGKEDVRRYLFERARIPVSKVSPKQLEHFMHILSDTTGYIDDNGTVGVCREASEINILVVGGPGKHSAWVPTFGATQYSVTRPIEDL